MKLRTTCLILVVAVGGIATSSLFADPPASADSPPSRAAATPSISALTCPSCKAENQFVPIAYGYIIGRPKPSIVDGEECEPPHYHRGGCVMGQEKWYCRKCGVKYGELSKPSRETAARLLAGQLANGNTCDRRKAMSLLLHLDPGETDAYSTVVAALDDPDSKVRATALVALTSSHRRGRQVHVKRIAPKITELLADPESDVRRVAVSAVGALEIEPEISIHALVAALRDPDATVRASAVIALRMASWNWEMTETVEQQLAEAISELANLLDDESTFVQSSAFRALLSLGESIELPSAVVRKMYTFFENAMNAARVSSLRASMRAISNGITSTHEDGLLYTFSPAVDAMFSLSSHAEIPATVARAIYSMFERELENGSQDTRYSAVRSIIRVSAKWPVPTSTIERLGGLFNDPSDAVRDIASKALLEVHRGDE